MAIVAWNEDSRKTFGLYVKLNSLLGLWPLLQVDLRLKIRMLIAITLMILMMVSTLYEMIQNCGNADDSLNNLLLLSTSVINLSKIIMYHVHRDELSVNIASAIEDWSTMKATGYRRIMVSYERVYKRITFILVTAVYWCATLYSLKELVIDSDTFVNIESDYQTLTNITEYVLKKRYLFPSACTLNTVSGTIYPALVLNQFVQLITCCIVAVGSDALFLAIATHLCGQFEILRIRLSNVDFDRKLSPYTTSREETRNQIARHQHLLRLVKNLESAYNKIVLIQILTSIMLISVAGIGFLIAMKAGDLFGSAKNFGVMLFMLLQSFMYSCIGEALQNHSNAIAQSVYNSSWYNLPSYMCKDFIFVMMRSNGSPYLTAGKFFRMTYATFMNVVKTSSSFLSVLRIMLNE